MTGYETPTRDEHGWMVSKARKALERRGWDGDAATFDHAWKQVAAGTPGGTVTAPIDGYRWRRWPQLGDRTYDSATPTPSYEIRRTGIILTWDRWIDPEVDFMLTGAGLNCREVTRQVRLTPGGIRREMARPEQLGLGL